MKKLFPMLCLVVMFALLVTGCGTGTTTSTATTAAAGTAAATTKAAGATTTSAAAKDVVLRIAWWGGDLRATRTSAALDKYTDKNKNVTFQPEYTSWDGYWDKLTTQAAASTLPDVIQQDYAKISQWINNKQLLDMTPYIKSGALDLSDVADTAVGGKLNNGYYGVSLGTNTFCLVFDPAVTTAAGVTIPESGYTWEQFYKDCQTIFAKTGKVSSFLTINDPKFMLEYIVRGKGDTMYAKDGKSLGWTNVEYAKKYFQLQGDLIKNKLSVTYDANSAVTGFDDNLMVKGVAWNDFYWSNQFVALATAAKRNLKMVMLPAFEGYKLGTYLKPSQLFSISATSKNPEASARFISYFTNDLDCNNILLGERGVPVAGKVREALYGKMDANSKQVYDMVDLAADLVNPIDAPEPANASEASTRAKEITEQFVYGELTVDAAAQAIVKQMNEILAK